MAMSNVLSKFYKKLQNSVFNKRMIYEYDEKHISYVKNFQEISFTTA